MDGFFLWIGQDIQLIGINHGLAKMLDMKNAYSTAGGICLSLVSLLFPQFFKVLISLFPKRTPLKRPKELN